MDLLIVIDMQPEFNDAACPIVSTVRSIIKTHTGLTLFLEYDGSGRTFRKLLAAAKHRKTITKFDDDGAREIFVWYDKHYKIQPKRVRVVGVNTDCCVASTVQSLQRRWQVEVLIKGCNSRSLMEHNMGINLIELYKNVRVVA